MPVLARNSAAPHAEENCVTMILKFADAQQVPLHIRNLSSQNELPLVHNHDHLDRAVELQLVPTCSSKFNSLLWRQFAKEQLCYKFSHHMALRT